MTNPVLLSLALLACFAGAFDWGTLARGVGGFYRRIRRAKEPIRMRAVWSVECGPLGPDGKIVPHTKFDAGENLIVNAGLDAAKELLLKSATALVPFGWIAIGTDATAEASGQTALGAEVARHATTYTAGGTGVATAEWTFPAGTGTGAITEGALFNDAAAGNMLNRKTWATVNKAAGDTLKVSVVLTLAPA